MEPGWRTLARAIGLSVILTSVFWVLLGGWLYHRYLEGHRAVNGDPTPAFGNPAAATALAGRPRIVSPSGRLVIPVLGVSPDQLTDTFGDARASGARLHDAIDIMAPEGTGVVAAAPGRIEKLFVSQDGGNTVYVRSPDGRVIYYYAHLRGYVPTLKEGARVSRGALLGEVGHTGDASPEAPHLHFAMLATTPGSTWSDDGQAINPYPLLHDR